MHLGLDHPRLPTFIPAAANLSYYLEPTDLIHSALHFHLHILQLSPLHRSAALRFHLQLPWRLGLTWLA